MAAGQAFKFVAFLYYLGLEEHNLETDVYKVALIKGASNGGVDPSVTETDPRFGAGGSVDYSAYEATTGGNYPAGGLSITPNTWNISGQTVVFDGIDIQIPADASNPTDGRWGILYNATNPNNRAVAYLDLGGIVNGTTAPINLIWPAAGIGVLQ